MLEVKVTIPKELLNVDAFVKAQIDGINRLVNDAAQDFASTCKNWSEVDKPGIVREMAHRSGDSITGAAIAVGNVYSWNNYDVERPPLVPVNAPRMVFKHSSGWIAKTQRGVLGSGAGANTGPVVFTKHVKGYTRVGRHWDETIRAKYEPRLKEVAKDAVKEFNK